MGIIRKIKNAIKSFSDKKKSNRLRNVFNRNFDKRVLISYIVEPFVNGINNRHTNLLECYTACKIFDDLHYQVDIIDYDKYDVDIDYNVYNVIYGFGVSVENSFSTDNATSIKRIVYATGCDTVFSNSIGLQRVNDFQKIHGLQCLSSARLVNSSWRVQIAFSNLLIALGNSFVKKTYETANYTKISNLNLFYKKENTKYENRDKDFNIAKTNFLWWGSLGAIHKGLDLLLDYFSQHPELNLYICGYKTEYPFDSYYQKMVADNANIIDMGFVSIGSSTYSDLLNKCGASILPSASEGGAAGIVNVCSNANIIPIITENCGLDLPYSAQKYMIRSLDFEGISSAIDSLVSSPAEELLEVSREVTKYFYDNYSFEKYSENLKSLITSVI